MTEHPKRKLIEALFAQATFVHEMGVRVKEVGEDFCETTLRIEPRHSQQDGYVHAGVCATMADHTAGGAAMAAAPDGFGVLTVECKVSFLRPAQGEALRCRASVLKAGKTISFVESEVFADGKLIAKASVTLAIVPWKPKVA